MGFFGTPCIVNIDVHVYFQGILERLNAGEVVVGDGGYITELERRGYACAGPWTPEVNVEHPDAGECDGQRPKQLDASYRFYQFNESLSSRQIKLLHVFIKLHQSSL